MGGEVGVAELFINFSENNNKIGPCVCKCIGQLYLSMFYTNLALSNTSLANAASFEFSFDFIQMPCLGEAVQLYTYIWKIYILI